MFSGSAGLGVGAALAAGALLGAGFAFFVVRRNANQVVAGTALNLLAVGLTGVAYRAVFGVTGAALTIPGAPRAADPAAQPPADRSVRRSSARRRSPTPASRSCRASRSCWRARVPGLKLRMVGENPVRRRDAGRRAWRARAPSRWCCAARWPPPAAPTSRSPTPRRSSRACRPGAASSPSPSSSSAAARRPASCWRRCSSAWRPRCSSTSRRWDWRCRSSSS